MQHAVSLTLFSDPTCVGDGMPPPISVSLGEGRGPRSKEHSGLGCSGDRLSLLSSSNEEFSPEALGNCVSKRGRGGGVVGRHGKEIIVI